MKKALVLFLALKICIAANTQVKMRIDRIQTNTSCSNTFDFLNNAIAVTQMYVLGRQGKLTTEAMDETFPLYYGALGIAVVIALFYTFKKESELVISMKNMEVYRSDKSENT